jgi:hypothetical protein
MLYGIIILATALILSLTAEYYSIMGLTAIFAAAVVPVIVMGASLGLGKVVATVWLHNNWKRIPWTFKTYLVPAIIFLMFLTSMGIFGYLSKAHLEQATLTGDSTAQVALFDEKIATQKDNIASARLALKQMDATVDQTIARSTDAGSVQVASQLRKRQQKERAGLQDEIGKAQTEIAKLQEQRAPLAAQSRKIEAEVGPIKYIAALIYGDNPDSNLLERAVRWVIILIVMVFDPLALCLILAASLQFEWARHGKGGYVHDEIEPENKVIFPTPPDAEPADGYDQYKLPEGKPIVPEDDLLSSKEYFADAIPIVPPVPYNPYTVHGPVNWTTTTTYTEPDPVPGEEEDDAVEEVFEMPSEWDGRRHAFGGSEQVNTVASTDTGTFIKRIDQTYAEPPVTDETLLNEEQPLTGTLTDPVVAQVALEAVFADRPAYFAPVVETVSEDMYEEVESPLPDLDTMPVELQRNELIDFVDSEHFEFPDEIPTLEVDPEINIPTVTGSLEPIPQIPDILNITDTNEPEMVEVEVEFIDPNTRIKSTRHEWVPAPIVADNIEGNVQVASDFGTVFPEKANKGDMYLRVDYLPTKLFKFNGQTWMHIEKTASDSYTYNEEYVKYLIAKIDSGEYSLDDLTETEQDQIAEYLSKD